MTPWIGVPYMAVAALCVFLGFGVLLTGFDNGDRDDVAMGLLMLGGAPLWPFVALAGWATHNPLPWSAEWRLERRINRAERACTLTDMRRKAESAEAAARRTFEAYIESETP